MANIFKQIPKPRLRRNTFNLSHDVKLTTNFGKLTPILCEPVVPGDTWRVSTEMLVRVAPLLAPVMNRVNIYTHFFFVPCRLIWSDWEKFITGGPDGTSEPAYPKIKLQAKSNYSESSDLYKSWNSLTKSSSLMDYLGFPTPDTDAASLGADTTGDIVDDMYLDALPFKAYQLIYNEYYRDENLDNEVAILKDVNGAITDATYIADFLHIRRRAWEKDYFTSALPWTQKGAETTIGLSGNANVILSKTPNNFPTLENKPLSGVPSLEESNLITNSSDEYDPARNYIIATDSDEDPARLWINPNGSLKADLSTVNATTINELRRAFKLQEYKEVLARSGNRYIELIRGLFGVTSSDARLQRPEFLGGGKTTVAFGEVLQTSETTASSPQANMAGRGVAAGQTHSFKRFFEEHGYIIGIMSIMPKASYFQGLPRKYYKFDRLDHYIPQFANIGEQEIYNQELAYHFDESDYTYSNTDVFGYTPRYAEYKYLPNRVHGSFKTNLDFWHMARIFEDQPHLNHSFIHLDPNETKRVFAVQSPDYDPLWCMLYHNIKATRPMPKFGVPLI